MTCHCKNVMVLTVGADTPSISRSVEDIKDEPCLPQHIFDENNVEWNINGFENIKEIGRGKCVCVLLCYAIILGISGVPSNYVININQLISFCF